MKRYMKLIDMLRNLHLEKVLLIFSIIIFQSSSVCGETFGRAQEPVDKVTLDGQWDIFLTDDPRMAPPFPKEGKAMKVDIEAVKNTRGPNGWSGLKETYLHAWYTRKIAIPESWKGRRVLIAFQPCLWEARVFLNGRPVGVNVGMLPFVMDATEAAKAGQENELLVIASGEVALLLDRDKDLERLTPAERIEFRQIVPNGHTSPRLQGRWMWKVLNAYGMRLGIQGGWLWSENPVYTSDVFVKSSVRAKNIAADVTVRNRSGAKTDIMVSAQVLDAEGKSVLTLPAKQVHLADVGEAVVNLVAPWTTPHLWDMDDPYQYTLVTEITENGRIVSTHRTVFGFREFWNEGDQLILNGKRFHMRSDAIMYPNADPVNTVKMMRLRGMNSLRICWSDQPTQETMDYFDANGILSSMEPGLHSEMGSLNLARQNPRYWEFFRNDMEAMLRQFRNHPGINSWCLANEFRFRGETPAGIEKVAAIKDYLSHNIDPTRPYWAADDYTLDFFDFRSMHGAPQSEYPTPGSIGTESMREMTLMPNGTYLWKTLPTINTATTPWSEFYMPADKPVMLDENAYLFFRMQSMDPLSAIFGEEAYSGSTLNAIEVAPDGGSGFLNPHNAMAHRYRALVAAWVFRSNRLNEVANFSPHGYDLRGGSSDLRYRTYLPMYQDAMAERTFFLHTYATHFYDDEKVMLDVSVHNDSRQKRHFTLNWVAGGTQKGERVYDLEPGMMKMESLPVYKGETLAARKNVEISLQLLEDGKELKTITQTVDIFPRSQTKLLPSKGSLSVFDPPGVLKQVLDKSNIKYQSVENLEKLSTLSGTLLIGPDALPESALIGRALVKYAESGGRVIILRQKETPTWLPVRLPLIDNTCHSTIAFPQASQHPLIANLGPNDFKFWRGDRTKMRDWNVVSLANYLMPVAGNYLPIVAAGGESGLFYTPLIEYTVGKGSIIGCQLVLTEKLGREPVADIVMRNLIQYSASPSEKTFTTAGIIPGEDKAGVAMFRQTGVALTPVDSLASEAANVFFVHASAISSMDATALKKAAGAGKTVFVYGISKVETVAEIGTRLGLPLVAEAATQKDFPISKFKNWEASDLLQGVNDGMYFWTSSKLMGLSGAPGVESQNFIHDRTITDIVMVRAPGALIGRGEHSVLASIPIGSGKVILSTFRWDKAVEPDPVTRTQRLLSVLATNLKVRVKSVGAIPPLEPANAFQVDLRKNVNMSFVDDIAENHKGGWTDDGGANDMRGMPLGMQCLTERMIPFDIIDPSSNNGKSVLLLGYDKNPIPRSVKIPVGRKAVRLFFLHAVAWQGDTARYTVRYKDGSSVEIPVATGVNISDWWSSTGAPNTVLVPVMNAYQMYPKGLMANPTVMKATRYLTCFPWDNPKPDSTIDSITFETTAKISRFVLVAITGQIAADAPADVSVYKMGEKYRVQNASGLMLSAENYHLSFGSGKSESLYHINPYIGASGKEYYATGAARRLGVTGEFKDGVWQGVQKLEFDISNSAVPFDISHRFSSAGDTVTLTLKPSGVFKGADDRPIIKQVMYWNADGGAATWTLSDGRSGSFSSGQSVYGEELEASSNPEKPSFTFTSAAGDRINLYLAVGASFKLDMMDGRNASEPSKIVIMYLFSPPSDSVPERDMPISWSYRISGESKSQSQ